MLEERFAQLEGRQAVTDRRLAAVEQRQEAGERRAVVVQPASSASSLTAQPDTAALPPSVQLRERAAVPTAAARPGQAAAAATAAARPSAIALQPPCARGASPAAPVQQPQPALSIGGHSFASEEAAWALIKKLKRDLLDRPIRWDDEQHAASFRWAGVGGCAECITGHEQGGSGKLRRCFALEQGGV